HGVGVSVGVAVAVAVAVAVTVGVGVGGGGQVPAAASFTRALVPSPTPMNDMQYRFVPPSRLSTTSMFAEPFGTGNGTPFPTTLSSPDFTLAIFTTDGPLGADAFLYLNNVAGPFALQSVFGSARTTGPSPLSSAIEESDPPTGSDAAML